MRKSLWVLGCDSIGRGRDGLFPALFLMSMGGGMGHYRGGLGGGFSSGGTGAACVELSAASGEQ